MSFFRPEAVKPLLRWSETAFYGAATFFGALWLYNAVSDPLWRWGLIAAVALFGAGMIRAAILSALAAHDDEGPGIVQIDERRIAYFGPEAGGIASINEIHSIDIAAPDPSVWIYEARWILRGEGEEAALSIPATAKGAEGLADAFSALPGFEPARAIAALHAQEGARSTIWRRPGAVVDLALARPDT